MTSFLLTLEMARANQSVEVSIGKKGSQNVLDNFDDEFQDSVVVCDESGASLGKNVSSKMI